MKTLSKRLSMYLQIVAILTVIMVCIPLAAPDEFSSFMGLLTFFSISFIVVIILAIPIWGLCEIFRTMKSSGKNSYLNAYLVIVAVLNSIFVLYLSFSGGSVFHTDLLSSGPLFTIALFIAFIISLVLAIPIWFLWWIALKVDPASAKNRKKNGAKKKPNRQPNNE